MFCFHETSSQRGLIHNEHVLRDPLPTTRGGSAFQLDLDIVHVSKDTFVRSWLEDLEQHSIAAAEERSRWGNRIYDFLATHFPDRSRTVVDTLLDAIAEEGLGYEEAWAMLHTEAGVPQDPSELRDYWAQRMFRFASAYNVDEDTVLLLLHAVAERNLAYEEAWGMLHQTYNVAMESGELRDYWFARVTRFCEEHRPGRVSREDVAKILSITSEGNLTYEEMWSMLREYGNDIDVKATNSSHQK